MSIPVILGNVALMLELIGRMDLLVDEARSRQVAEQIKSKARKPFVNAYKAALLTPSAFYVQGFLVYPVGNLYRVIEHSWLQIENQIIDPNLPHLNSKVSEFIYFSAQRLTVKKLKAAVEEAKEDYPEDDPLPIYGDMPYEYYGDVMLGGRDYQAAYEAAEAKCHQLNQKMAESN